MSGKGAYCSAFIEPSVIHVLKYYIHFRIYDPPQQSLDDDKHRKNTHRFGEAVSHSRDKHDDVHQVALVGRREEVCKEYYHHFAWPDVVLDNPLKGVRPILRERVNMSGTWSGDDKKAGQSISVGLIYIIPAAATNINPV